ncbi:5-oxoprolinase subunit PxpB [Planococcus salinus]|uniref:5-oxoprolinase subunit PxpB n=1 Tax=Planococcus salinus TaxID=1848460 RepID=A0A3M8P7Q8_9BACL|nr:5-oxoprolinase subunit PxpB [Planococcus salinus]RNF39687.1 5-oxoprolinase subunit PxpB [Planococcus salinus]
MTYSISPFGDCALMIEIHADSSNDTQQEIQKIVSFLETHPPVWLVEYIPAFTTVAVLFDPLLAVSDSFATPYDKVRTELQRCFQQLEKNQESTIKTVELPVCYGGEWGPDLEFVASHNNLSPKEVIRIHSSTTYRVAMIGFAPGFPFLEGMSEKIAAPRKDSPRLRIPERSVGIAGKQTGVYPIETPGGWQLIGRTPLRLFLPEKSEPSLLRAGDFVRFVEVSPQEYEKLEASYDQNT